MKDTEQKKLIEGLEGIWTGDPSKMPEGVSIVKTTSGSKILFTWERDDKEKVHVIRTSRDALLPRGISRIRKGDKQ